MKSPGFAWRFACNTGTRPAWCAGWGGKQQIIYKHAISTIAPLRPVDLEED